MSGKWNYGKKAFIMNIYNLHLQFSHSIPRTKHTFSNQKHFQTWLWYWKEKENEKSVQTMSEEKRGLMGRNTSLSNDKVGKSSIGMSNSKMLIIDICKTELLKYCPVGLTGWSSSSSSCSKYSILALLRYLDTMPLLVIHVCTCIYI